MESTLKEVINCVGFSIRMFSLNYGFYDCINKGDEFVTS